MKIDLPLITIGVPVYNEEKNIETAINAILNQDYQNIKILVADNFSNDKTFEILLNLKLKDDRIQLFRHEKNIGPRANWIFLLNKADTKYFIFIGGHDIVGKTFLSDAIYKLETIPEAVAVYPITYRIDQATDRLESTHVMYDDFKVEENTFHNRIIQVIKNCTWGSAIHSVYRIEVLRDTFVNININGGDLAFFLNVSTIGRFLPSDNIGLYMSNVKLDESSEERERRYVSIGFSPKWKEIHSMYPYEVICNCDEINLFKKIKLLIEARIFMYRFKVYSWKEIYSYFIKKHKMNIALKILLCRIYESTRKFVKST